jgi:hypothetical protein
VTGVRVLIVKHQIYANFSHRRGLNASGIHVPGRPGEGSGCQGLMALAESLSPMLWGLLLEEDRIQFS